jgi:hypothetical protein
MNVETDAALTRLASAYPRARYLHLTRHPVTTQRSMQQHWNRIFAGFTASGQPMSGIASWVEIHCRILRFARTLPRDRYMRIRAEDVLNNTGPQLRSIAAWMGIRIDEDAIAAMTHPEASPFASLGCVATGIVGGNDPKFLRDPTPHPVEVPRTLDRPLGWVGNSELWAMTVNVANQLGYA